MKQLNTKIISQELQAANDGAGCSRDTPAAGHGPGHFWQARGQAPQGSAGPRHRRTVPASDAAVAV